MKGVTNRFRHSNSPKEKCLLLESLVRSADHVWLYVRTHDSRFMEDILIIAQPESIKDFSQGSYVYNLT